MAETTGKKQQFIADSSIIDYKCKCDQFSGECRATAVVTVDRQAGETFMNDPVVIVGTVQAVVTEQVNSPIDNGNGSFTHKYDIEATGLSPGYHTITAETAFIVNVPATPVQVKCE